MARFPIINGGNACVKGFLEKAAGRQPGESFGESSREACVLGETMLFF